MWHAVTAVTEGYDPILYEGEEQADALVLNAGPDNVRLQAWPRTRPLNEEPHVSITLFAGEQRIVAGGLLRVHLSKGRFAAVAWRLLNRESGQ